MCFSSDSMWNCYCFTVLNVLHSSLKNTVLVRSFLFGHYIICYSFSTCILMILKTNICKSITLKYSRLEFLFLSKIFFLHFIFIKISNDFYEMRGGQRKFEERHIIFSIKFCRIHLYPIRQLSLSFISDLSYAYVL